MSETDRKQSQRGRWRIWLRKVILLSGCCAVGVFGIVALLLPQIEKVQDDTRAASCQGNLSQLGAAFNNFREYYGTYPPAYITDEMGKPAHSWRVLILPHMEGHDLFLQYDFSEPWNGPSNQKLHTALDRPGGGMFHCSSLDNPLRRRTTIFAVVRPAHVPSLVKPAITARSPDDQLLLIEDHSSAVHWMQPADLTTDDLLEFAKHSGSSKLSSPHRRGVQYLSSSGRASGALVAGSGVDEMRALLGLASPEETLEPRQQEQDNLLRILGERLGGTSHLDDRLVAALLLGQLGFQTPLARELLQKALQDNDPGVRAAAKLSLGKLPPDNRKQ